MFQKVYTVLIFKTNEKVIMYYLKKMYGRKMVEFKFSTLFIQKFAHRKINILLESKYILYFRFTQNILIEHIL